MDSGDILHHLQTGPFKYVHIGTKARNHADSRPTLRIGVHAIYLITGCEHLIGRLPRTTGSNLSCRPLSPTLKTKASGCQRPSKQWCFVPVCEHGHGGCDDSSGDTRLKRGLPFGRMPWIRPPRPMPEGI